MYRVNLNKITFNEIDVAEQWSEFSAYGRTAFTDHLRDMVADPDSVFVTWCDDHDEPRDEVEHLPGVNVTVCEECRDNYFYCEDCDEYATESDMNSVNGGDKLVCDYCYKRNYVKCDNCEERFPADNVHSVGGGEDVCEGCYENSYIYCEHCDESYHMDTDHDHDCGCESPQQHFAMPNGDTMIENDTTFAVTIPAGTLSEVGMTQIQVLLQRHGAIAAQGEDGRVDWRDETKMAERTKWYQLALRLDEVGQDWQNKQGNFPKRVSRFAYKEFGLKVPATLLSSIGNVGRDHSQGADLEVEITRNLNLSAYDFGHEESCWWGGYSSSRCALKNNGGFGLRSFGRDSWGRRDVTGRAWVMPLKHDNGHLRPTFNAEGADAYIVFNGYGNLGGYAPARIVAQMTGMTYKKVGFGADPMYINGESGYLVASQEILAETGGVDLDTDEHARLFYTERNAA